MSNRQKVLFRQLQLIILGLVVLAGGLLANHLPFVVIGVIVALFGILRYIWIAHLLKNIDDDKETEYK